MTSILVGINCYYFIAYNINIVLINFVLKLYLPDSPKKLNL